MKGLIQKIKKIFSRNTGSAKPVVDNSLTFKERLVNDMIPFIEGMIEKEKNHLDWLESKNADKKFIKRSKRDLDHLRQRHREYVEYAEGL